MVDQLKDEDLVFSRAKPDVFGDAHPKALLKTIQEDGDALVKLANQHIITCDQFDRQTILQLFRLASKYESNPKRYNTPLQGKILISAFYEQNARPTKQLSQVWGLVVLRQNL